MKQSKLLIKTKKLAPKSVEAISHKLLLRGDFISQVASGVYSFLPLGWRVHRKIEQIIREEMEGLGAQEIFMPSCPGVIGVFEFLFLYGTDSAFRS